MGILIKCNQANKTNTFIPPIRQISITKQHIWNQFVYISFDLVTKTECIIMFYNNDIFQRKPSSGRKPPRYGHYCSNSLSVLITKIMNELFKSNERLIQTIRFANKVHAEHCIVAWTHKKWAISENS